MNKRGGFTLVELLVAIGILAIVAVLGWRGLDGIVRARIALTEQMETTRGMQLAFAQMQSDSDHVAGPEILDRRPFLHADDDRLTLVRTVLTENEPSYLQVISYRVVDGVLTRRESLGTRDLVQLDQLWQAAISDADTTPPVRLQSGVAAMQVLVWQNNAWRKDAPPNLPEMPANTPLPAGLAPTGVQVAVTVQGLAAPLSKAFLLGEI